jgi:hypothetical protein
MENTYKLEYVFGILTIKKEEKEQQDWVEEEVRLQCFLKKSLPLSTVPESPLHFLPNKSLLFF